MRQIKIILLLLAMIATNNSYGQTKEETVYGFGYAYNYNTMELYVTNIVSGVQNSDIYFDATDTGLSFQWRDKLKTVVSEYFKYTEVAVGFRSASLHYYDAVHERRVKVIGEFKQEGFSIYEISDFYFSKKKR